MKFSLEKLGLDRFSWENLNLKSLATPGNGIVAAIGATIGPFVEYLYGTGRSDFLVIFFGAIAMDWIAGIAAAQKDKVYSSEYGITGVYRTIFICLLPAFSNKLDVAFGTPGFLFYGATLALVYHTWQSMTANIYRAGWGRLIPKAVLNFVGSEIKAKSERAMRKNAKLEQKEEK